jgi:hypothetical protein
MPDERPGQHAFKPTDLSPAASDETNRAPRSLLRQRRHAMMIFMLAAAMTLAMLIATAFGLHQETERARLRQRAEHRNPYRLR